MPAKQSIIWKILLAVYLAGLFFSCFANFNSGIDFSQDFLTIPLDKVVHFLLFLPFPIICHWAFPKFSGKLWFTAAVLIAGILIGGGIEILQGLSDYRSKDVLDFAADCVGLGVATVIVITYKSIVTKKND